jgi:hypothetical protein
MPTITLTRTTLEALGVSPDDFTGAIRAEAKLLLEPLLASRGFDVTRTVHVVELASGEGFVLTQ